jgi:hypothetical protein
MHRKDAAGWSYRQVAEMLHDDLNLDEALADAAKRQSFLFERLKSIGRIGGSQAFGDLFEQMRMKESDMQALEVALSTKKSIMAVFDQGMLNWCEMHRLLLKEPGLDLAGSKF